MFSHIWPVLNQNNFDNCHADGHFNINASTQVILLCYPTYNLCHDTCILYDDR